MDPRVPEWSVLRYFWPDFPPPPAHTDPMAGFGFAAYNGSFFSARGAQLLRRRPFAKSRKPASR